MGKEIWEMGVKISDMEREIMGYIRRRAGNEKHFEEGLKITDVVATANLFNFIGDGLPNARDNLLKKGFNLAKWK